MLHSHTPPSPLTQSHTQTGKKKFPPSKRITFANKCETFANECINFTNKCVTFVKKSKNFPNIVRNFSMGFRTKEIVSLSKKNPTVLVTTDIVLATMLLIFHQFH